MERRRSTPLKSPDPCVTPMALGRKGPGPDLVHVTPVKNSATASEPLTPTANLKMLISAASPDIRDREMKKVLFRPIENEGAKPATPESPAEDPEAEDSCQVSETERPCMPFIHSVIHPSSAYMVFKNLKHDCDEIFFFCSCACAQSM